MQSGTLAKRYAAALAELAKEQDLLDTVGDDLAAFLEVYRTTPSLAALLTSPTAALKNQQDVLKTYLQQASPSPLTGNFLGLLVKKRRMSHLEEIVAAFRRNVDGQRGRVVVNVQTPMPLTKAHIKRLETVMSEVTGRQATVEVEEKPELLGGLVVRIGSVMWDYSIRSRLHRLKAHMMG
ncbi:MAG: ATP synthase F1 subunit delta [Magnetococcales bacterium]|nr:ATP synthase F1 subunit delta [Magnetococcales bacterium]